MNSLISGCRMCFEKYKIRDLSKALLLCRNCENTPISQTFKQCKYCRSDFKNSIDGDICVKCKAQIHKHGEPTHCTICNLQMAFGNEVICIRCSHYRAKFGDAKKCENCQQFSAFYKDESSRKKVDGKLLCWLCTYFYKLQKAKAYKASKRRVDVTKSDDFSSLSRNDSSSNLIAEPMNKKLRVEEDTSMPLYSNDAAYNEQLLKVSSLQEEIKDLKRKLVVKENELLSKDNLITGLKADLLQNEKDTQDREIVLKNRWYKDRDAILDKVKALQRENASLSKGGKRKRQTISGLEYLTRDPLTRAPSSFTNSPKNNANSSPKPVEKTLSKLEADIDVDSPKTQVVEEPPKLVEASHKPIDEPTDNEKFKQVEEVNQNTPEITEKETDTPELSLNSNSKDTSSAEVSPKN